MTALTAIQGTLAWTQDTFFHDEAQVAIVRRADDHGSVSELGSKNHVVVTNRNASGATRGLEAGAEVPFIPPLSRHGAGLDPFEVPRRTTKPGGATTADGEWYNFRGVNFAKAMEKAEAFGWKEKKLADPDSG
jgi:hypothetical protein